MTSRERVQKAINHEEADRIPIDFGGFGASTILAEPYHNLLEYMGINKSIYIADTGQFLPLIDSEVKNIFQVDTAACIPLYDGLGCRTDILKKEWAGYQNIPVLLSSDFLPEQKEDGSWLYSCGASVLKMPSDGYYFDMVEAPYKSLESARDVERVYIPLFSDKELNYLKKNTEMLRQNKDPFIIGEAMIGWSDIAGPWLGTEKFYIDLISNPQLIHALFEKMNEVWIKKIDQLAGTIGAGIDAIPVYNDLGSNQSGLYSNQMVRDLITPYIKRFMDHVERVSDYHIIFHSCGSVVQYIPDLIDAGIKILNPVQIGAKGMDAASLKKEYGSDLVFWGGAVDPQHTLMFGSAQEVESEVKKNIEILKKDGGFIFCNPHNIQAHVDPENIVSLFEAAKQYGTYMQ